MKSQDNEGDPNKGLPKELVILITDQSIVLDQDLHLWNRIGHPWPPCNTATAELPEDKA